MKSLTMAILAGAALLVSACAEDPEATAPDPNANANANAGASGLPPANSAEYFNVVIGDRVFFALDRYDLTPDAQSTLVKQAQWLLQNPDVTANIEGHADERGTREYNLALGARRANSVRRFLTGQGVPANRLNAVSYGKERPVALCSEERCWSQNRRSVTVVAGAPVS